MEDSRPQAILKFHRPSSLDYRARHGLPVPPSHEVAIFTKFHEDWTKIVDFLLIANYLAFPIFYYPYFSSTGLEIASH